MTKIMETGKYDFQLDMETENSNATILKNIAPYTRVLELGCAHGRMTKFLKENLHCKVTIAEIDEDAGTVAAQWADKFYIGKDGDIERDSFFDELNAEKDNNFDYIVFADVLEHLRYPEVILEKCKKLLSPTGTVWVSIPNVSHNAVLIDLWNDLFKYREVGLLDNTHLRFFTAQSLGEMVTKCGLKVVTAINLKNVVENTEFHNSYDDVPPTVAFLLKRREHGEVYQFIWELKDKHE
jgi:2-polyprenyl-3-methyl-5-hydroxy-6-metoxy-1,4-benzoquinol methylase